MSPIHSLIDRIEITPSGKRGKADVVVHGLLAEMLGLAGCEPGQTPHSAISMVAPG